MRSVGWSITILETSAAYAITDATMISPASQGSSSGGVPFVQSGLRICGYSNVDARNRGAAEATQRTHKRGRHTSRASATVSPLSKPLLGDKEPSRVHAKYVAITAIRLRIAQDPQLDRDSVLPAAFADVPSLRGRGLGGSSPESKPLPRDIRILLRPGGPAHPNLTRVGGLVLPGCGSDCTLRVLGIVRDSGTSKTNQPEWVVPGS